jgi:hypothetical protein
MDLIFEFIIGPKLLFLWVSQNRRNIFLSEDRQDWQESDAHIGTASFLHTLDPNPSVNSLMSYLG